MRKTKSMKQRVIDWIVANPEATAEQTANKFNISRGQVYVYRSAAKKLRDGQPEAPVRERGFTASSKARDRQEGGDHYKTMGVQPWDVVDTWPREQRIGYYRGGALKYLMRMGAKDQSPIEVAKGQHYIEKLLEVLKEEGDGVV